MRLSVRCFTLIVYGIILLFRGNFMKAARLTDYGGKGSITVVDNAPKPAPKEDEVLVEIHAAAVNPFDWKVREGHMQEMSNLPLPATLGGDFAGVVAEVGKEVSGFEVGAQVYGQAGALSGHGSFAEFAPVKASSLALKPKGVDFAHAAALPLTGVSAYQALVEHAGLKSGQKVLIHGGAGGIGSYAIPLAKHLGAYVTTTAAAEDADYVKGLGADEVIDYKNQDFSTLIKDYDAVYDTVGGDTYRKSYQVLKPGGVIVSMLEQPDEDLEQQYKVHAVAQFTRVTTKRLNELTKLVEQEAISPRIDKTFTLDETDDALEYLKTSHHRGKVVIRIK